MKHYSYKYLLGLMLLNAYSPPATISGGIMYPEIVSGGKKCTLIRTHDEF